jgi:hypothetical protein
MSEESELIVVRAFSQPHEAHLACSALQAAGLEATVADVNIVSADWLYSNAVGGVKLLVRAEDASTAREVLDTPAAVEKRDEPESVDVTDAAEPSCPRCGGRGAISVAYGRRMAVLSWLLTSVPLFPVWRQRRCQTCGFALR